MSTDTDSEELSYDTPEDITSIFGVVSFSTLKISLFLFLTFIVINSDVFIDRVLSNKDETYASGRHPTGNGIVVQGVILVIMYMLFNMLVTCQFI